MESETVNITASPESELMPAEYQAKFEQLVAQVSELMIQAGVDDFLLTTYTRNAKNTSGQYSTAIATSDASLAIAMLQNAGNSVGQYIRFKQVN